MIMLNNRFCFMETKEKYDKVKKHLAEIEHEAEEIINRYISEVAVNPKSNKLEEWRKKLDSIRQEQIQLFDQMANSKAA